MSILDKIIQNKKEEIKHIKAIDPYKLQQNKKDFIAAILAKKPAIIAELKSKSPSEGIICPNYQPVEIAKAYEKGGACCLSVLTDSTFFNGSYKDLENVSNAVLIPTLCKDFIIDKRQVHLARASGASACLLIVRILTDQMLIELKNEIESLGMNALIEVFDHTDIERIVAINPKLIGINNRNLDSLEMNAKNAADLSLKIPKEIPLLSLSGAKSIDDIKKAAKQFSGVLAGTFLMRAEKPEKLIKRVIEGFVLE